MSVKFSFRLKEPHKEESLLVLFVRWDKQQIKLSTKQRVRTETWDGNLQVCITSREKFSQRINSSSRKTNALLKKISEIVTEVYEDNYGTISHCKAKELIQKRIDELLNVNKEKEEKKRITPIVFFSEYIEKKRIDSHTGRYIGERTKIHQRTVIKRLKRFLEDKKLPDDFAVFSSRRFDAQFTEWCYSTMNYKQNTVYATYGVLKPLLNAAKAEGFEFGDDYKSLKGKCNDVDAIYLTEEEIDKIYHLDIPTLIEGGEIDSKSTIEITRDLFIIGCWTGLRRSDLSRLNKALFDIEKKTISITPEKTKRPVVIPMHPSVLELWHKYKGNFPKLIDKGKANNQLRECARHAGITDEIRITENRGGVVKTLAYKKYQLVGMHTARRSFATNMYKRRFPTIAIMKLTGHTTEHNFLKYIKVTAEENAAMMAEDFYRIQNPFED